MRQLRRKLKRKSRRSRNSNFAITSVRSPKCESKCDESKCESGDVFIKTTWSPTQLPSFNIYGLLPKLPKFARRYNHTPPSTGSKTTLTIIRPYTKCDSQCEKPKCEKPKCERDSKCEKPKCESQCEKPKCERYPKCEKPKRETNQSVNRSVENPSVNGINLNAARSAKRYGRSHSKTCTGGDVSHFSNNDNQQENPQNTQIANIRHETEPEPTKASAVERRAGLAARSGFEEFADETRKYGVKLLLHYADIHNNCYKTRANANSALPKAIYLQQNGFHRNKTKQQQQTFPPIYNAPRHQADPPRHQNMHSCAAATKNRQQTHDNEHKATKRGHRNRDTQFQKYLDLRKREKRTDDFGDKSKVTVAAGPCGN